jgi:hypothetical protein
MNLNIIKDNKMNNNKKDILANGNSKNLPHDCIYAKFNDFIFSTDTKILGKLLHRFKHFLNVQELPGDIVEVGVFKGSGMSSFLKFIEIFSNTSNKKVIGFDIFGVDKSKEVLNNDTSMDQQSMNMIYDRVDHSDLSLDSVKMRLKNTNISEDKFILVEGDVENSIPKFLENNPGFRISLLYIDVDIERPTYFALKHLWDRVLPGGVIIFDEFEYHKYSESSGVEKFLKEKEIPFDIKSTNWIAPTAFMYKKTF